MKTLVTTIAVLCLLAVPAMAQSNTLYGQEGTAADGYAGVNAAGQGGALAAGSVSNWKYQTGAGSWSGVYSWDSTAWVEEASSGDSSIKVEADIELYWSETTANNEIYFHIGNPFTATTAEKTAYVDGTYAANHLEYIGISFENTSKLEGDFDIATGTVAGGMVGTIDNHNTDISAESFDIQFMARVNSNPWVYPTSFGAGAHGTIPATLWWSPVATGMTLGSGTMQFLVKINPTAGQADGNYHLDPTIVTAPEV